MRNKPYFLALNRMPFIGPQTVKKLLSRWPSLSDLFSLSPVRLIQAGLPEKLALSISQFNQKEIEADLDWEQATHHHLLTWEDPRYPALLREIHDPPFVLYATGDLSCFNQPCLAIIGTRKPSPSGKETARRFAYELGQLPLTIVSGLALGIDAEAHKGCLQAGGKTIAVLGTGIDRIYPRQHAALGDEISEKGLLLSEFPLKSPPIAGHFPRRNRIISGLSLSILVVEAAIRSGTLITARLALEQNRDVLAIPGSIHNPQSRGSHYLLQQGAKLVTCAQDVVEEMTLINQTVSTAGNSKPLATNRKNLVQCVGFEMTTLDQVMSRSGLDLEEAACELAMLELEGVIQSVPGGYIRCCS